MVGYLSQFSGIRFAYVTSNCSVNPAKFLSGRYFSVG
jgi:hypothetical protein